MSGDLVLGIDVSTTGTKVIAWDAQGQAMATRRAALVIDRPAPHYYEQNPRDWWMSLRDSIAAMTRDIPAERIAGLAIAHQRETVAPVLADGTPVRQAILWLDQRARGLVEPLAARIGPERLRSISGKTTDFGPVLYKLEWLRLNEPENHRRTNVFCDVQGYLVHCLTGEFQTSWPSADPLALFDLRAHRWSPELCEAVGIDETRLPQASPPGTLLGRVKADAAAATGLRRGTPVYGGGGDGQAAGLGVDALHTSHAYLNLGTAVVFGVYSNECLHDPAWRTMGSCSGRGFYLESSLRSGALLSDWFLKRICGVKPTEGDQLDRLEEQAAALPPGSHGTLLLPYWEGAMNPYWDMGARGCILGLSDAHDRAHVYRALIEGVALEQALVLDLITARTELQVERFTAIGGVAGSDLWCRIMADTLNTPIERSQTVEAASLGAAMCAAAGCGWYRSIEDAARGMRAPATAEFTPDTANQARYRALLDIYRDLYPQIADLTRRLTAFTEAS